MHMLSSGRQFVYAEKSETLIRAMQACAALGLSFPSKQAVKWLDLHTPDYDNSWEYWQPFGLLPDGSPFIHSWARGAFGYLYRTLEIEAPAIQTVDPAIWHHGVLARVTECNPDPRTLGAAELMNEQTDPEQLWGDQILSLYEKVRAAQANGTLLYDPVKIRRRMKA